jgi:hypothetical protein
MSNRRRRGAKQIRKQGGVRMAPSKRVHRPGVLVLCGKKAEYLQ